MSGKVLCALEVAATTTKQKTTFLTCWDDSQDAEACATSAGISSAYQSCASDTSKVASLKQAAATKFEKKWPTHAKPGGPFHVPHILASGKDMDDTSYSAIIKQLCSSGITAGACSSVTDIQV
jgi:hypothetical protein